MVRVRFLIEELNDQAKIFSFNMNYNKSGAILRTLATADLRVENYQELLPHICTAKPFQNDRPGTGWYVR